MSLESRSSAVPKENICRSDNCSGFFTGCRWFHAGSSVQTVKGTDSVFNQGNSTSGLFQSWSTKLTECTVFRMLLWYYSKSLLIRSLTCRRWTHITCFISSSCCTQRWTISVVTGNHRQSTFDNTWQPLHNFVNFRVWDKVEEVSKYPYFQRYLDRPREAYIPKAAQFLLPFRCNTGLWTHMDTGPQLLPLAGISSHR